jgi:hypothetical protein
VEKIEVQELAPGVPDKHEKEEQAGPQDQGEKTMSSKATGGYAGEK